MQKLVWQNANGVELDLTSGNYGITEWEGFSNTSLNIQQQQVPFQDGGVFLDALMEQRELSVTLAMQDRNNLEERYRQRRELISALNPKLGEGYLIYTNDFISKRIKCVPQIPLFETHNSDTVGTPKASLSWTACEPYWEDLEETEVEIGAGELVNINNEGDIKTGVKIDIISKATDTPTIRNIETDQKITINGVYTEDIEIDTNTGRKTVTTKPQNYKLEQGGVFPKGAGSSDILLLGGTTLIYTKNGVDWKIVDIHIPQDTVFEIKDIIYINDKNIFLVMVKAETNMVFMISSDCENWEYITVANETFEKIIYANNKYYAIGPYTVQASLYESSDLSSWTKKSEIGTTVGAVDLLYANNQQTFLILTKANPSIPIPLYPEINIWSSIDGISWTKRTTSTTTEYRFTSICYAESKNIFCGVTENGQVYTSYDTASWDLEYSDNNNYYDDIYYSEIKRKFYTYGRIESPNGFFISTSSDTVNWDITETDEKLEKILYASIYGSMVCTTSDGDIYKETLTWEKIKSGIKSLFKIIFVSEEVKYYAFGYGVVYESQDKKNWQLSHYLLNNFYVEEVAYHNGLFVIGGHEVGVRKIGYGTDLSNLQYYNAELFGNNAYIGCIKYIPHIQKFVRILYSYSQSYISTSSDGVTWSENILIGGAPIYDLIYSERNGIFIVCGFNNTIYTSSDMNTWTQRKYESEAKSLNSLVDNGELYVAVGSHNIMTSIDGVNWNIVESYNDKSLECIKYDNRTGLFIAVGWIIDTLIYNVLIYTSINAIDWESNKTKISGSLTDINVEDGVVLVGVAGDTIDATSSGVIIAADNSDSNINIINRTTKDSDMTFCLKEGLNKLQFLLNGGSGKAIVKYRQKYIGV